MLGASRPRVRNRAEPPPGFVRPSVVKRIHDEDGVPSEIENGAPNGGDGNDDNIPDAEQESVTSLEDPAISDLGEPGANYVTIISTDENEEPKPLADVSLVSLADATPPPDGAEPQTSLLSFTVENLAIPEPGGDPAVAIVEIYLPQRANSYWKYDLETEVWTDASSIATFDELSTSKGGVDRWRVVVRLEDGGPFDADVRTGFIKDPAVAVLDEVAPEITCPPDQRFILGAENATLTATVTDPGPDPAVQLITVDVDTATIGSGFEVTINATDRVGNEAIPTNCKYAVGARFVSFSPTFETPLPLDANAGRSAPLIWRLTDADGNLLGLETVGTPEVRSRPIECEISGGIPAFELDEMALDSPIQLPNGSWFFIWRTSKSWSGTCRIFEITYDGDLEPHTLIYRFR